MPVIDDAVAAVDAGELVVYPTETVYGLGGNALDHAAIERVFTAKDRPRSNPVSLAVASLKDARAVVDPEPVTERFMAEFLPGPVTVICPKRSVVPDVLTGGRPRVGVRVPSCNLARELLDRTPPLTATSANVSGRQPVCRVDELDATIRRSAGCIVDGGETPGGSSTVVDVASGRIHRRGRLADEVAAWLATEGR